MSRSWEVCVVSVESLKNAEYRFGDYAERTGRAIFGKFEACKQVTVAKSQEFLAVSSTNSPRPVTSASTISSFSGGDSFAEEDSVNQTMSFDAGDKPTESCKRLGQVSIEFQVGDMKKRLPKTIKVVGEVSEVAVGLSTRVPEPRAGETMVVRLLRSGQVQDDALIGECEISQASGTPMRYPINRKRGKGNVKGYVTLTVTAVDGECKPVAADPASSASLDTSPIDFLIEKRNRIVDKYMQVGSGKVANDLTAMAGVHMRQPLLERPHGAPVVGECIVVIESIKDLAPKVNRPYLMMRLDRQERRSDPEHLIGGCEADLTYRFLFSSLQQDLCIYIYDDHSRNRNVALGRVIIPLAGVPWDVGDAPTMELVRQAINPRVGSFVKRFDCQFMPMSSAGDGAGDANFVDHFQVARKRKDGRGIPGSGMYKAHTFGHLSLRVELSLDPSMRPAVRCVFKQVFSQLGQFQEADQEQEQAPSEPDLMGLMQSKVVQQAVRNCERLETLLKAPSRGILRWIRAKPWHGLAAGLSWFAFCCTGLFPPPAWALPLYIWAMLLLNGIFVAFQRERDWTKSRDDAFPVWNEEMETGTPTITELVNAFTKGVCSLEKSTKNVLGILDRLLNILSFADGITSVLFASIMGLAALLLAVMILLWRELDPTGSWFSGLTGLAVCFFISHPPDKNSKKPVKGPSQDPMSGLSKLNKVLECVPDQPEVAHRYIAFRVQCVDRGIALKVTLIGATGLRNADHLPGQGLSDPYCICTIPGKSKSKFQTKVINDNLNPVWNHEEIVSVFTPGDSLEFHVWDKDPGLTDDFLGKAKLNSSQFYPRGFSGELELQEAGKGIRAHLLLKIEVLQDPRSDGSTGSRRTSVPDLRLPV